MGDERMPKRMLHIKMKWIRPRGRPPNQMYRPFRKDIEMRGGNWEGIQENRKWENRDGCNSL